MATKKKKATTKKSTITAKERYEKIVAYLEEHKTAPKDEVRKACGVPMGSTIAVFMRLRAEGVILEDKESFLSLAPDYKKKVKAIKASKTRVTQDGRTLPRSIRYESTRNNKPILGKTQKRIVTFVQKKGTTTVKAIARHIKSTPNTAKRAIGRMQERSVIEYKDGKIQMSKKWALPEQAANKKKPECKTDANTNTNGITKLDLSDHVLLLIPKNVTHTLFVGSEFEVLSTSSETPKDVIRTASLMLKLSTRD